MKRITIISSSLALGLVLALSGCGGGGSADTKKGITISGKAIDPYLKGSKVCLDLNKNRVCDVHEPHTTTNDHGDYALEIAKEHHDAVHALCVTGGTDIGTGKAFTGTLTAVKEAHQTAHHITPLTTAVEARYQHCQEHHNTCHETVAEIEANLAAYLELTEKEINADIVALSKKGNHKPLTTALALYNAAVKHNPNNPYAAYQEVAQYGYPAGRNWEVDLRTLMPKSAKLVSAIMSIDEGVLENAAAEAANAGVQAGTAAANAGVEAGVEAHSIAHQIAQYVYGLVHQTRVDAANAGVQAGESAANAGVQAGNDAANAGVEAGEAAANAGVQAGNDAANAGVEAGEAAANAGVQAGNDAANAGVEAGEAAANAGVQAGNDASNAHDLSHDIVRGRI